MARYTGADCKRCRREKMKLFLKGSKCDSPKCPIEIRPYPPGEHGRNRPKESEFLLQVREKQKARRVYGVLERQFHSYYEEATRRRGKAGENLLQILEILEVRAKSLELTPFIVARAEAGERQVPAWLEVIPEKMRVLVHTLPVRAQIDTQVQEQLIVEFYSK